MEEIERELTAEELYQKKIADEFERLKNLPKQEIVFTEEQIQAELQLAEQQRELKTLQAELNSLSQDLIQAQAGAVIDNLDERKARFQVVHNRIREIMGKEPRVYNM